MNLNKIISEKIEAIFDDTVEIRRHIHRFPDLSGSEKVTAKYIFNALSDLGLDPKFVVRKTGIIAEIKNGNGELTVLRADIDALPVEELNNITFKSEKLGVMHACGHDIHAASLIGAARVLIDLKSHWNGTVCLIFQPSEEVEPGGAYEIIKEGEFPKKADSVFGLHVSSDYNTGTVAMKEGADYSGVLVFDVKVKGHGGHGAMPHKTVDPIVCAASMIIELQTLISRESPPFEPTVLTVGTIHAGTKRNIIPDEALFQGTIRTFSEKLQDHLHERVQSILKSIADSFRAEVFVKIERSYPSGYNNPELTKLSFEKFKSYFGDNNVINRELPTMFSEDFAYYQQKVPGLYIHLGVKPLGQESMDGIHSARFLPEEESIKSAIAAHVVYVFGQNSR